MQVALLPCATGLGVQVMAPFTALVAMAWVLNAVCADTWVAPVTVGAQGPVPLHAPDQPLKGRMAGSSAVAVQVVLLP
jgi:hypothetical protein